MNKLKFCYRMHLNFEQPVIKHYLHLRCIPFTDSIQQIYGLQVKVLPVQETIHLKDGFNNSLMACQIPDSHIELSCEVKGMAYVEVKNRKKEELQMLCYAYFSPLTKPGWELKRFFTSLKSHNPFDIMNELYKVYHYCAGITNIHTGANEAFKLKKGVCQDYAHIFISLCRMANIPARYVAGFLAGEGYTHAWVEIYQEGMWIGMDPTHNRMVDNQYIKVAQGRDYSDCALENGIFFGAPIQRQEVYVSVEVIDGRERL